MTKGGPSFGRHQKRTHIRCRRCGRHAYNIRKSFCAACGFGKTTKRNKQVWRTKTANRQRRK